MNDEAWELAQVILHDETRATTVAAALAESRRVTLSALPLSAYAAEIRRDWRLRGHDTDAALLAPDVEAIFDRLGTAVRAAVAQDKWDWGDHPPTSFASWLERELSELHAAHRRSLRDQRTA